MSTCTSMFDVKIHDSFSLTFIDHTPQLMFSNSPCLALRNFIDSFRCEDPNIEIPSLGAAAARHICGLSKLTQNEQGCSSYTSIYLGMWFPQRGEISSLIQFSPRYLGGNMFMGFRLLHQTPGCRSLTKACRSSKSLGG